MKLAQRRAQHASLAALGQEACRLGHRRHGRDRAQGFAQVIRVVRLDGRDPAAAEAEPGQDGLRQRHGLHQRRDVVARLAAEKEPHGRGAKGEGRGDVLQADLGDLVDGKRQHIGGQPVAESGERIDQRVPCGSREAEGSPARRPPPDRRPASRAASGEGIGRRQRMRGRPGRADRGALTTTRADIGVDHHMIAGRCDGAGGQRSAAVQPVIWEREWAQRCSSKEM